MLGATALKALRLRQNLSGGFCRSLKPSKPYISPIFTIGFDGASCEFSNNVHCERGMADTALAPKTESTEVPGTD